MLHQGHESECVENGLEAVNITAVKQYDLILMVCTHTHMENEQLFFHTYAVSATACAGKPVCLCDVSVLILILPPSPPLHFSLLSLCATTLFSCGLSTKLSFA